MSETETVTEREARMRRYINLQVLTNGYVIEWGFRKHAVAGTKAQALEIIGGILDAVPLTGD